MRKKIFTLIIIFLIAIFASFSFSYPYFKSFTGNSSCSLRSYSASAEAAARRPVFSRTTDDDDEPDTDCTGNIAGFIALGILGGTFVFFAWCWRIFKKILAFIFRPVKKLLGIQDNNKSEPVIITAPAMSLKPIKQYYKLDPEFDGEGIKALIANLYVQLQNARQAKDISSLRPYMTDKFYNQVNRELDAFRTQHKTEYTENIAVLGVSLKGWRQAGGMDYITLALNARIVSYILDDVTGKLLSGDRTREKFMEYEIDLSRKRGIITAPKSENVQANTCPNCGAPVNINASARCEYCGNMINQVNIDWAVCAVRGISQRNS